MNTRYTVTSNGNWWDVRNPRGKRITAIHIHHHNDGDPWSRAVRIAHQASLTDQLRDWKHAEMFPRRETQKAGGVSALIQWLTGAVESPRQSDYALAH